MDGDVVKRTQTTGLTRALAEQASAVTYDALPEAVRVLARQCVLDYYGVALAGADDPLAHILLDELAEAGGAAQARAGGGCRDHRPLKRGLRFSLNEAMPSRRSSVGTMRL